MAYVLGEPTVQQYFDTDGSPLESGTIEFYITGTSTPTAVYSDSSGTSLGTSVTLNTYGAPKSSGGSPVALFFDTNVTYKIIVKDSLGTQVGPTVDPFRVRSREVYNVLDYGAVKGDSSSNASTNTTAFQAAIDALNAANGGEVYVPNGTYWLGQINLYYNITFRGESRRGVLLKQVATDGNDTHFIVCKPDGNTSTTATTAPKTEIRHMTIDGRKGLTASTGRDVIHVAAATEDPTYSASYKYRGVNLIDVEVTNGSGTGLWNGNARVQSYVENCRFTFNGEEGIRLASSNDCKLIGCGSGSNTSHSLFVGTCAGAQIINCQFWDPDTTTDFAIHLYEASYVMISNCIIEGNQDSVMKVSGRYGVSGASTETIPAVAVISNCIFKNSNPTAQVGWIEVSNAPNLVVSGCNFSVADGNGVPDYVIYENDAGAGTASSVFLDSVYQLPDAATKYYDVAVTNSKEILKGPSHYIQTRIPIGTLSGTYTWSLTNGNYQYTPSVATATTVTVAATAAPDGVYTLIARLSANNITVTGHDYVSGTVSPTASKAVITAHVVAGEAYLKVDSYS